MLVRSVTYHDAFSLLMRTADFDYHLPHELIAQQPAPCRDESRLLVVDRATRAVAPVPFKDLLKFLRPNDLLVMNNSRVVPARLRGLNNRSGGKFEMLLLEELGTNDWWALMRPGKRAQPGTEVALVGYDGQKLGISARVMEFNAEGHRRLQFLGTANIVDELEGIGELPLPPYIERPAGKTSESDRERYQTVFAGPRGSVAAPTAGLHFTPDILERVKALGVQISFVTLHVGLGTFAPVKTIKVGDHKLHQERYFIDDETASMINQARRDGRRIIAVGTTVVRVLESVVKEGHVLAGPGRTSIFIYPPYRFRVVDALLTNFHLPQSTLLMLVSAFAAPGETHGRELVLHAYQAAVAERFRFFSYGDAMLLI